MLIVMNTAFKKMGGKGMSQRMNGRLLVDTTFKKSRFESILHRGDVDVFSFPSRRVCERASGLMKRKRRLRGDASGFMLLVWTLNYRATV
jgi:hypothetical protein